MLSSVPAPSLLERDRALPPVKLPRMPFQTRRTDACTEASWWPSDAASGLIGAPSISACVTICGGLTGALLSAASFKSSCWSLLLLASGTPAAVPSVFAALAVAVSMLGDSGEIGQSCHSVSASELIALPGAGASVSGCLGLSPAQNGFLCANEWIGKVVLHRQTVSNQRLCWPQHPALLEASKEKRTPGRASRWNLHMHDWCDTFLVCLS